MMLDFPGFQAAHDAGMSAVEQVLAPKRGAPRTPNLGGSATTLDMGQAIARQIRLL